MSWCQRAASTLVIIAALVIAGCQRSQTADATPPRTRGAPATAGSAGGEHVATPSYRIDITYPSLDRDEAALGAMLHRIARAAQQDFQRALPDPKLFPEFADRQLQLRIDFKLAARTSAFTSVRETGLQDSGGAHPAPIDAAIVYNIHARRTLPLDDLFAQPDTARRALADFARTTLAAKIMAQAPKMGEGSPRAIDEWKASAQRMITEGTQPTSQDFANYIVRAGAQPDDPSPGLTLIFPPYQVAAYVYGTQVVDVPARIFVAYLKPQYRRAFVAN